MSEPDIISLIVEAMRDNPYISDERLLGTTDQDERMEHYARIAVETMHRRDRRPSGPLCLCGAEKIAEVNKGGTCGRGGCPYGGDF